MKKTELFWLILPTIALVVYGFARLRGGEDDTQRKSRPFKLTLDEVTTTPHIRDNSDVDVRVVIGHDGPAPRWWGKWGEPSIPGLEIGDTFLEDGARKRYRKIQFHTHSIGIYATSRTFDSQSQHYVYTYSINTAFVPPAVSRLTFHSNLVHTSGTNQVSVVVRNSP